MGRVAVLRRFATSWYVSVVVLGALSIAIGYLVFFHVFTGKPKIGVIDIPFTVINDNSAFVIGAFLDYARERDDIKAVVIKLVSPGGGAASSEKLLFDMRELRKKKPVVMVDGFLVASGGYMMSLGANYTYATPTSLVGSIGVVVGFPGPLIPPTPNEQLITSGPLKGSGFTRRQWIMLVDQVKEAFAQMVVSERGDKLMLSREELLQGRIWSGIDAVNLGLVDALGSDTEAIEKAADLAGISNYGLVDVNVEVFRIFVQKSRRVFSGLEGDGAEPALADLRTLMALTRGDDNSGEALEDVTRIQTFRRLFLPSGVKQLEDALPAEFQLNLTQPNIYYIYVGPSR